MKIMVVGGGGREHAIIKTLKKKSGGYGALCAAWKRRHRRRRGLRPEEANDIDRTGGLFSRIRRRTLPWSPRKTRWLWRGGRIGRAGIPCFGPNVRAALIESRQGLREIYDEKNGNPTAAYEILTMRRRRFAIWRTCPCRRRQGGRPRARKRRYHCGNPGERQIAPYRRDDWARLRRKRRARRDRGMSRGPRWFQCLPSQIGKH